MSRSAAPVLVDRLIEACGGGRVLCVAADPAALVTAFRRRAVGADAHAPDSAAHIGPLPDADGTYDLVVADASLDHMDGAAMAFAIAELLRVTRGAVAVITHNRSRIAMERAWLAHPCRKHPLHQLLVPYEGLDWEHGGALLLFQPLPRGVLHGRDVADLAAGRNLHMDMLREAGGRADAHVARYMFARQFVRPGDRVIDAACGLGYGAAILTDATLAASVLGLDNDASVVAYATDHYARGRSRLTFETRDVLHLAALPAGSIDAIVSFETIEHIPDPDAFLAACQRVLTPAGRFIGSVPNAWVDEHGVDPNPHHLHVFDRTRLEALYRRHFHVEQVYGQTAGGGMRLPEAGRLLWNAEGNDADAEWWLAVGMKDVDADAQAPVRHGLIEAPVDDRTNVLAFDRDYANPWLVRAMVTIGLRTQSDALLTTFVSHTLDTASPESADAGAALCVQAYRAVDAGQGLTDETRAAIARYVRTSSPVPHVRRWQVSLLYVSALASLLDNDVLAATRALEACVAADVLSFSPLLATKTVGAAFLRGWLALQARDIDAARRWWTLGVDHAETALHRPWDDFLLNRHAPALFGLREAAVIVNLASQCATGVALAEHARERPGVVAGQLFDGLQERARKAARFVPRPAPVPVPLPVAQSAPVFSWSLLTHLDGIRLRQGDPTQLAKWDLTIGDRFTSALMLHPPGEAELTIPCGEAGRICTAVAIHPDAWGRPGAQMCLFTIRVDTVVEVTVRLDPHRRAADRRWVEVTLDVPPSMTDSHIVTLTTQAPHGVDYGWALFRGMTFVTVDAPQAA